MTEKKENSRRLHFCDPEHFLAFNKKVPVIDVRTPAEFEQGHIPGAFNFPMFDNEERIVVGTLYKQKSRMDAVLEGTRFVGKKLHWYIEEAQKIAKSKTLRVHCWRGGMRSEGIGWLLSAAGFEVHLLNGGYKAYRHFIKEEFNKKAHIIILSGMTGSGKTEILTEIKKLGEQVVDLEALANHKGSAFGALGQPPQPTIENFGNDLYEIWKEFDLSKPIWLEDESMFIGRVVIPQELFSQMTSSPVIKVQMPLDLRIQRLLTEYSNFSKEELYTSFEKIIKRTGTEDFNHAIKSLNEDNFEKAAGIALKFYDKAYLNQLSKRKPETIFQIDINNDDPLNTAKEILNFVSTNPHLFFADC